MSDSEVYATPALAWHRRHSGVQGQPLAYFNDEYRLAIFPEVGGPKWELHWAAVDAGYELLELGMSVDQAKAAAAREVAEGRVSRVA